MADMKWIKLATDIPDNMKIKRIRRLPDGNNVILFWVFLLARAGDSNSKGGLFISDRLPYTVEDLADDFGFSTEFVRFALLTLEKNLMIEIYEEIIFIKNWEEYQSADKFEKIREQNRIRQANYREKQKLLAKSNVTRNGGVTESNATEEELELDKELDKDKDILSSSDEQDGVQAKSSLNERFNFIWEQYPKGRKQGREKAFNSYKKALKDGITDQIILNGLNAYKKQIKLQKTELQYIKQGSTWFNGKCWNDEYITTNDISNDKPDYVHVPKEFRT